MSGDKAMVVIPTRSDRLDTLYGLIDLFGASRIVLVHTAEAAVSPSITGCLNLQYDGPMNIQAWWTHGIRAAGSRFVVLSNDDIVLPHSPIPEMVHSCLIHHRVLARIAGPGLRHSGPFFLIDTASGIEPDCGFQWWWGDDDLYRQAERNGGITDIWVDGVQHRDGEYGQNPAFMGMIAADKQRYMWKWGGSVDPDASRGVVVGSVHRRTD